MHIVVPALKEEELTSATVSEDSTSIQSRVENARATQIQRQGKANNALGTKEIETYCQPDEAGVALLKAAMAQLNLSARAYHRVLKLARTIADMSGDAEIKSTHIAEAVQYRRNEV